MESWAFYETAFIWKVGLRVLGLQGSPHKKGSSDYLLNAFMQAVSDLGADVQVLDIPRMNIRPCIGCGYCEKKGVCVIDNDDMAADVYALLRSHEVIVAASPVFFYSVTAQLKAMIDRLQRHTQDTGSVGCRAVGQGGERCDKHGQQTAAPYQAATGFEVARRIFLE